MIYHIMNVRLTIGRMNNTISYLHEFSDKFIESWSSKKPLINMEKPDEEDPVFMKVEGRHYLPLYAPYYKIVHNYLVCLKYTEITYGKWNHLNVTVDLACLTRYITIPSSNRHSDISNMVYHSSMGHIMGDNAYLQLS
jgi:hypothetical protein